MAARRKLYGKISADLRHHPKLIASARSLQLPRVHLMGHLTNMWLGALEFAEDGDLWRGDDEASLRFFESLADISGESGQFLEVFRKDRWLDGWLIHDWLDHTSELLIARYSSHNRQLLVEIYKKHNRVYGNGLDREEEEPHPDGTQGEFSGSGWEVNGKRMGTDGNNSDPPLAPSPSLNTLNPITPNPIAQDNNQKEALNPLTPVTKNKKSPMGGMGGNRSIFQANEPRASFLVFPEGSGARGYPVMQAELTGNGWTHKEVFEAFFPLLFDHSILSLEAFYERVKRSKASPAAWIMLYLDKIHAVYRNRQGGTLLDDDADPVGMTMAGLILRKNRTRHCHTEAARSLFIAIMTDYQKSLNGERRKWPGKLSGATIVYELEKRKGKASKIA